MEHTTEQLQTALTGLGFQKIDYPSDKYGVFEKGELRYFVGTDGSLRRGASVSRSVAVNDEIPVLLSQAIEQPDQPVGEKQEGDDRHSKEQHEAEPAQEEAADDQDAQQSEQPSTPRLKGSKQQLLVDLLSRAEGATIKQIAAATGWQAHSVRGVMSGVLKKKLRLHITSEKSSGGERLYRVAAASKAEPAVQSS